MPRKTFEPGNDGHGGGRPQGSKNRLQTKFLYELAEDFAINGAGVIKICRIEKPVEYLRIIASVLPRELQIETNALSDMSDEDIAASLSLLQKIQLNKRAQEESASDAETKH
jgi:hypothetical protein